VLRKKKRNAKYFYTQEYLAELPLGICSYIHEQGKQPQAPWTSWESAVLNLPTPVPQQEQEKKNKK